MKAPPIFKVQEKLTQKAPREMVRGRRQRKEKVTGSLRVTNSISTPEYSPCGGLGKACGL